MSRLALKGIQAAAGAAGGAATYVDDLFSTHLYTGTGSTLAINNGIDLSGEGGLVWSKCRSHADRNVFIDTERGRLKYLRSDSTAAEATLSDTYGINSFNSNGYTLGANADWININTRTNCSWTFRKQPGFFDVVTYTGNGSNRTISHNLGSVPGVMIVKRLSDSEGWQVYHRDLAATEYLELNSTNAKSSSNGTLRWNSTRPTATEFSLGTHDSVNANGSTYVAYLFAHDAQDFGEDSDEAIIKCGSYTGTGSEFEVNLGFEPQWLLVKNVNNSSYYWWALDTMRGLDHSETRFLYPNTSSAEAGGGVYYVPTPTGFTVKGIAGPNNSGNEYIYVAIRRPHKPASEFAATDLLGILDTIPANASTNGTVISTANHFDMIMGVPGPSGGADNYISSRFQKGHAHRTQEPDAEFGSQQFYFDYTKAFKQGVTNGTSLLAYTFARAPGFFDVVAYSGSGTSDAGDQVAHNLGVIPDMVWRKKRNGAENWAVWLRDPITPNANSHSGGFYLNTNIQYYPTNSFWNQGGAGAGPTATHISKGLGNNGDYIVYLFASVAGVSKVGTYTGTGSDLNVNCGFSSGARFVLIKRTDSSGDWYLWDSLRGIVAGNDPYILLNTSAAEVSNTDYIDPLSSGFTVTSSAPAALNASSGEYVFLAIA